MTHCLPRDGFAEKRPRHALRLNSLIVDSSPKQTIKKTLNHSINYNIFFFFCFQRALFDYYILSNYLKGNTKIIQICKNVKRD